MDCVSCGAELRPGARFCNQCGAVQPATVPSLLAMSPAASNPSAAGPVPDAAGGSSVADESNPAEDDGDGSLRLKRPPRVLRAQDEAADHGAEIGETAGNAAAGESGVDGTSGRLEDEIADDDEETRPSPAIHIPSQSPEAGDPRAPMKWPEVETVETEILPIQVATTAKLEVPEGFRLSGSDAIDAVMLPDADTLVTASAVMPEDGPAQTGLLPPHALSWPLPVSLIIGGRYRVETVLQAAAPDEPDGENLYRVSDLKGYERCWSCGQEYGEGTEASDRFCRECGADMLGREYLMYERRLQSDSATMAIDHIDHIDQAKTEPEHPVVTGTVAPEEERTFIQNNRSYRVVPRVTEPSPFPHGARILVGVATDVGRVRAGERNEDSLGTLVLNLAHDSHMQPLTLGIVADGLGGHVNGQDASRLVTRIVTEHILHKVALPLVGLPVDGVATEDDLKSLLLESAHAANAALCSANEQSGADMGSTLVCALLFGSSAYIINVGDSRGYVFHEGQLRQITTDHSFVEQLIASGFVAPENRYTHPQRNQILRSLGDELDVEIDLFEQKLQPGMRFMLCSDGLWEMVRDDESAHILGETTNPQEACDRLVESANEHGGEDNISVVVIEVRD